MLSITYETKHYKKIGITPEMPTSTFQAESIAFVVSEIIGLDTSDYSFGYVASWSSGKELKELQQSLSLIEKTSREILTWITDNCSLSIPDNKLTV